MHQSTNRPHRQSRDSDVDTGEEDECRQHGKVMFTQRLYLRQASNFSPSTNPPRSAVFTFCESQRHNNTHSNLLKL
jgi:hypothetical protein